MSFEVVKNDPVMTITPEQFKDHSFMKDLREKFGYMKDPFYGVNEDDEPIEVHIYYEYVKVITYQHDHWIRKQIYREDGTHDEYFEGKW